MAKYDFDLVSVADMAAATDLSPERIRAWLEKFERKPVAYHGDVPLYMRTLLELLEAVHARPADENLLAP